MTAEQRLYRDLAWPWPIISPPSDYMQESEQLARMLNESTQSECRTVLHLGCGGGHHDHTLANHFSLTGVDLNPAMINHAQQLNPGVEYHVGDMRTFGVEKKFDAVLLLDSNHYLASMEDLRMTFDVASKHLRSGGVILTVLEWLREEFAQNSTLFSSHSSGTTDVTVIENLYDPNPDDTEMECTFVYLIREEGHLRTEVDRHTFGLFSTAQWMHAMQESGFAVDVVDTSGLSGDLYNQLILIGQKLD